MKMHPEGRLSRVVWGHAHPEVFKSRGLEMLLSAFSTRYFRRFLKVSEDCRIIVRPVFNDFPTKLQCENMHERFENTSTMY